MKLSKYAVLETYNALLRCERDAKNEMTTQDALMYGNLAFQFRDLYKQMKQNEYALVTIVRERGH